MLLDGSEPGAKQGKKPRVFSAVPKNVCPAGIRRGRGLLPAVPALAALILVLAVLILALVLAVLVLVLILVLVLALILVAIHVMILQNMVFTAGPLGEVCPKTQDLSFALKKRLASSPAATAAVIPPAVALSPPVSVPKNPSCVTASLTPFARL